MPDPKNTDQATDNTNNCQTGGVSATITTGGAPREAHFYFNATIGGTDGLTTPEELQAAVDFVASVTGSLRPVLPDPGENNPLLPYYYGTDVDIVGVDTNNDGDIDVLRVHVNPGSNDGIRLTELGRRAITGTAVTGGEPLAGVVYGVLGTPFSSSRADYMPQYDSFADVQSNAQRFSDNLASGGQTAPFATIEVSNAEEFNGAKDLARTQRRERIENPTAIILR